MCQCNTPCNCEPSPCVDCPPVTGLTPCLDGESCAELVDAHCVIYTGEDLDNIDADHNDRLDAILRKLNLNWESQAISTEDTNTVDLTGSGLVSDKLKADVKISAEAGNALTAEPDGLFVPALLSDVVVDDSTTIALTGDGSDLDPLIATAIIDPAADNQLEATAEGLYVPGMTTGDFCALVEDTFADDEAQMNTEPQDDYRFLAHGAKGCTQIAPPTGFAVSGSDRVSAFGAMEWFDTLVNANASAVSGESVLIYNDSEEVFVPKDGVDYIGIGMPSIKNFTVATDVPYKGSLSNLRISGTVTVNADTAYTTEIIANNVILNGNFVMGGYAKWIGGRFLNSSATNTLTGNCYLEDVYTLRYTSTSGSITLNKVTIIDTPNTVRTAALYVVASPGSYSVITNCYVRSTFNLGIYCLNGSSGTIILTHTTGISYYSNGINYQTGSNSVSSNNIFTHCTGVSYSGHGIYTSRAGLIDDLDSLTNFEISHNTGFSTDGYGIMSVSSNLRQCSGYSINNHGIYIGGSDWAYLNCSVIECVGESRNSKGLAATRDIYIIGGTYKSNLNTSAGNPISLSIDIARPSSNYLVVGVKTIAVHEDAYAIKGAAGVNLRVSGCDFLNFNLSNAVTGIDPLITLRSVTSDIYGNRT